MKTLLKYQQEGMSLVDIIKKDDIVIYNGGFFSDCTFFTKGNFYAVKVITPTQLKITCNMSWMSINIFPNGLNAFTLKEES